MKSKRSIDTHAALGLVAIGSAARGITPLPNPKTRMSPTRLVALATAFVAVCPQVPAIFVHDLGSWRSESFDSLDGESSSLPAGWSFLETGSNANTTLGISSGSSTVGNTYSFGPAGSSDRALGGLRSGSLVPLFGVQLTNGTGGLIDVLDVDFTGEQWRMGTAGRVDRLDFQFSRNASSLVSGLWEDLDVLDFIAPTTSSPTFALDGNDSAHRVTLKTSITGLTWTDGDVLWLRWVDFDATGSDDGLAVDDFRVRAWRPSPPPSHAVPDELPMAASLAAMLLGLIGIRRRQGLCGGHN